ncbi:MAG: family tricarboxylate transporter, receptor protein [Rhodospirillales bacterium]|nr:family tricarboxylate transporter, receptor protein [Rhodospirillales bacterium]
MVRWSAKAIKVRQTLLTTATIVCAALVQAALPGSAAGQSVADFYKGKDVEIVVGYGAGGGYDLTARAVARHIGKYIPGNPKVIVRNMPGAGSIVAANHVNNVAPKDGSTIGVYADFLPIVKLLGLEGVQFDPIEIGWLGAVTQRETPTLGVRTDAPATTLDGIKKIEITVGSDGTGATSAYAFMLNDLVGTKLKVLTGYTGTSQIDLALERGEVHGRATIDWVRTREKTDWLKRKLITPIVAFSLTPVTDPDLKNVPLVIDLAKSAQDRQVMELVLGTNEYFRAFSTAPKIPADRLAALREAFAKTMQDKEFQEDFTKATTGTVQFSEPKKIQDFMARVYKFPPAVIKQAAKYASP